MGGGVVQDLLQGVGHDQSVRVLRPDAIHRKGGTYTPHDVLELNLKRSAPESGKVELA